MDPAHLTESQLKSRLCQCAKLTKERMAPLLYYLREKLKKQGSRKGKGFGAWVAANLPITRRTADLWANEYGVAHGLMKPTSRKISKSWVPGPPKDDDLYTVELAFEPEERRAFTKATRILGAPKTQRVIYEAVLAAANVRKPNAKETSAHGSRLANGQTGSAPRNRAASA
jgi:hypothetical protein